MTEAKKTSLFDLAGRRVYVAGHNVMVGAALVRRLRSESCTILTVDHAALDLTRQAETEQWLGIAKPDAVVLPAAKVGGIAFNNSYPVDFLSDNLAIAHNVIRASHAAGGAATLAHAKTLERLRPHAPGLVRQDPHGKALRCRIQIFSPITVSKAGFGLDKCKYGCLEKYGSNRV
jgi:hypothetical protein